VLRSDAEPAVPKLRGGTETWTPTLLAAFHVSTEATFGLDADEAKTAKLCGMMSAWTRAHCVVDAACPNVSMLAVSEDFAQTMGYAATELQGECLLSFAGPGTPQRTLRAMVRRGSKGLVSPSRSAAVLCAERR